MDLEEIPVGQQITQGGGGCQLHHGVGQTSPPPPPPPPSDTREVIYAAPNMPFPDPMAKHLPPEHEHHYNYYNYNTYSTGGSSHHKETSNDQYQFFKKSGVCLRSLFHIFSKQLAAYVLHNYENFLIFKRTW